MVGEDGEGLNDGALLEDVGADVLLEVDQVRAVLAGMRGNKKASALHLYDGGTGRCVLESLDRLDEGTVGVEGTILVGEGRTLLDGDGDADLGSDDGVRGREEREGDGDEGGLAEHG